jgi:hypothetical protein
MQELGTMNQQYIGNAASDVGPAKQALEHVIQSGLSVVFRLRKPATKPAEFSGPNTTNSLYLINEL